MYPITFGAELRRRRKAGGYTLRSFAAVAHVSYAHLSKLETGKQPPTPEVARVIDAALGADGALVALAAEGRAARVRGAVAYDPQGRNAEDMHRRMLLNAAATLAVGVAGLAGIDIDPSRRRRIGMPDVERIEAALSRMWAVDHERGAGDMWDIAVARAQSLSVAMDLCDHDEATGRRLLTVTGHAYVGAGWFALDAGRDDIARSCYNEALSLARQAGDSTLTVHTLANLALQALFLDQPRRALRYIDAAEQVTPAGVPDRQDAVLKMRRGRALAQLGEASESGRELTAARRMLDGQNDAAPERLAYFTEAEIDANAATAALELDKPRQAVRLLERALPGYNRRFGRNLALYQVRLAHARAADGQLDGSAEAASQALDGLAGQVVSRRVAAELDHLISDQLAGHRTVPAVADVLDRHATLQRA